MSSEATTHRIRGPKPDRHDGSVPREDIDILIDILEADEARSAAGESPPDLTLPSTPPQMLAGRFRLEGLLGEGGFGRVWRAFDLKLQRPVAVKVPHRHRVSTAEDADAYLTEARIVAALDHPHIVPVFDVGGTEDCPCFLVSMLVEGGTLVQRIGESRLSAREAAGLVATVAQALHYAHRKGLVHRDIKPGNILIDHTGKPFVVDFGMAIREENFGLGPKHGGTPAYMSPEQARGEGHRVDGRSDIFSLGVVFYELLAGRRPFVAESREGLLERIIGHEARPPRQSDDGIPKELERICLKALAKRASERYTTAKDMADELHHFLAEQPTPVTKPIDSPSVTPVKIVPKGLRSFDAHDADFFLELLPGPRDRDGLPDSIRFWKTRIEETDDDTFPVGLIYGPSGCGKSSLVKAGLLPRLAGHVIAVYVEADAEDTESRLLNNLRKRCPALSDDLSMKETLAALRRGQGIPVGKKVVIVLDQFEQWLHAKMDERDAELIQALRQCDGGRVQCIVMVRDDFGMAATRFMGAVDIPILQGHNFATVDLFDLLHSRKVLAEFGRAFGRLPDNLGKCTKEQEAFIDRAVSGLAQEGKVISVRLALFAEMVKGKLWTPATLKVAGGMEGVGVSFLEETFTSATANPKHRQHQKAAQAVLKALLPDSGTDIKGNMRSHQELLAASGYEGRPEDFDAVLRILDGEIRLITPTDPERDECRSASGTVVVAGQKYYQLTHDYLVHSLRDWLTRKQKETRRGRAELLLADRAALWNDRPENRQLPSLVQWFQIRSSTAREEWTQPQTEMMRKAKRYHTARGLFLVSTLVLLAMAGWEGYGRLKAHTLRDRLLDSTTADVPGIVEEMAPFRPMLDRLLHEAAAEAGARKDARKRLHCSLALLPVDPTQVEHLYGRLLDAEPHEVPVIRDALAPHGHGLLDGLWSVVESPEKGKESQRLRAAAALAKYDPQCEKWAKASALVVNDLVLENALFLALWSEAFRPVKGRLLSPLKAIFRDRRPERVAECSLATNLLADYAAEEPQVLADLVMDADEKQFAVIYPKFREQGERCVAILTAEIDKKPPPGLPSSDSAREELAKRQANAAVALLRMNRTEKVWPLLRHGPDPRVRSYLVHRLGPLGADAKAVVKQMGEEKEVAILRGLLLSLGEFDERGLPPKDRTALLPKVQETYRTAGDPGLHGASEWLLRTWKQEEWLRRVNEAWAKDESQRKKREEGIKNTLEKERAKRPQWYVNGQGQTMVVIPGPVEFVMGSPKSEGGRLEIERQHQKRIGRTFALAAKSVTVGQYRQFDKGYELPEKYTRMAELPVGAINWYMAAAYCNWLSEQEGIEKGQWCYETKRGETNPKPNYLSLMGYRLPTEAEMEYATRAGATTSRYYGETDELLTKYAWYYKNSEEKTWPVGSLKPNDLGLFDVQGNVSTWCQERIKEYPAGVGAGARVDTEDALVVTDTDSRVLRGGSFLSRPSLVRSALRSSILPAYRLVGYGFRPARTYAH